MRESIRIIGGQYRGKKIHFPDIAELRPTPNRIRETLFNWLMNEIRDSRCLDAFAGSGALGFEAFSRGATQVVLLENAPIIYDNLQKQARSFPVSSQLQIIHQDALIFLKNTQENFDIIFLDPPFASTLLFQCIELLEKSSTLRSHGWLYIESPQRMQLNPAIWEEKKAKKAGQVFYALYQKIAD